MWQPCTNVTPKWWDLGGSQDSVKLEFPCIYCGSRWGCGQLVHSKLVLSLPGGNLLERLCPWEEWTVVISRSGRQETTRRTWTLCRWELLVGLSELPRSGRTHRESPCPKAKQEGVKMEPKSLERRFRVWSGQPALVNRERHKLSNTHHPCRVSLSCRTCPAEAGITEYFGVSLLGIYLFIPSFEWPTEELTSK